MLSIICLIMSSSVRLTGAMAVMKPGLSPSSSTQIPSLPSQAVASEGSLVDIHVAPSFASKPGSEPGFFNPKRRLGRDFVVLSTAYFLSIHQENARRAGKFRPVKVLDATCAAGVQGLRVAMESPLLARSLICSNNKNDQIDVASAKEISKEKISLQVVLNDLDETAADLAAYNVNHTLASNSRDQNQHDDIKITVTQRVAQAMLHEESFEVSILDPFGSVQPYLDAAISRTPHNGIIEICATDVNVLYGTRPRLSFRHYGTTLAPKRPPCFRERGIRMLLASVATSAGRMDRGIIPIYSISSDHYCLVSVRVVRRGKGVDRTSKMVKSVKICRSCGDHVVAAQTVDFVPQCDCDPVDGAGSDAFEEGPLWTGPLHDLEALQGMNQICRLDISKEFISKETHRLLTTLLEEASIDNNNNKCQERGTASMFFRRPITSAGGDLPKLAEIMKELKRKGFQSSRTHFCAKSLKSNATAKELDNAVISTQIKKSVVKKTHE